jgi:hypothetical protein
MRLPSFKSVGRAVLVALVLGSTAMVAAPAQAQPGPSLNFHIGPGGPVFSFGWGGSGPGWGPGPGWGGPGSGWGSGPSYCLNNAQISQYLRSNGWRNVDVKNNVGNNRVRVVARWNGQWYQMRVNRCNGQVDNVQHL